MARWLELVRRGMYLSQRSRFDDELYDEMQFHIDMRASEIEASGLTPRDALAQARREFGSEIRLAEETRGVWQFQWLEDLASDFRYAVRSCRRHPVFTLAVAASLAIGVGANGAVFTAADAVFWKRLAITEPETLVRVSVRRSSGNTVYDGVPRDYVQELQDAGVFTDVVTQNPDGLSFAFDGRAERIVGQAVSPQYFSVLGIEPALGQGFSPEVRAGRWAPEAVLSYRFWQRRFGGDPGVIGRAIRLNTYPFVIVGVSSPSFLDIVQGQDPELRVPVLPPGRELAEIDLVRGASGGLAVGRLARGLSPTQAEAILNARLPEFVRTSADPRINGTQDRWAHVYVSSAERGVTSGLDQMRAPLLALLALSGIVLFIACANVAGMLLARATARQRELAARVALGAGRARLIRQLFAESMLFALIGGALAAPFTYATAWILPGFLPKGHSNLVIDLRPDARVLLFTAVLALIAGVAVGLLSAFHATRGDITRALKADSAAAVGESRRLSLRRALVAVQVAFSLVMLAVAGLFVRSLTDLRPSGFAGPTDRVLLFTLKPQPELYQAEQLPVLFDRLRTQVAAIPGVQAVALASTGPLASRRFTTDVRVGNREPLRVSTDGVTPDFFDVVGLRLIAGRDFRSGDSSSVARVAIINATFARRLFDGAPAIGRTVDVRVPGEGFLPHEVIGVVSDAQYHDLHVPPTPTIWLPDAAPYMPTLHVRTTEANTGRMVGAIMHELDAIDDRFPVFDVKSLDGRIADALSRERMVAALSRVFGVLALVLAAVGLYGVLSHSVSRKTREIGLRMALGSSVASVRWLVVREAAVPVVAGTAAGVAIALAAGRVVAQEFLGVAAIDAATLGISIAVMGVITGVAVSVPAFRASRVDPLTALRAD